MAFKVRKKEEAYEEEWMLTFADMMSLLVCFFVILLSISEPKTTEMEKIQSQFKSSFVKQVEETKPVTELADELQRIIQQNEVEDSISVEETPKGLMLELASASLYAPGSADIREDAIPLLEEVTKALANFDYEDFVIEVEGHTDDVPIKTERFPSNWELSAGRAASVVRFLVDDGIERQNLKAIGLADVTPLVPNLDEFGNPIAENREQNRRIVVRIERRD